MWSNFHTHSKYCDGKGELRDIVALVSKDVSSLGFSSHAPVPFDCKWCMKKENLNAYLHDIAELKKLTTGPEIYASLEIDFIPGIISPLDFEDDLDYTIGSIHFIDQFPDGRPWEIDGLHSRFLEGLEKIFANNAREAFIRYFELTREMIITSTPDIIGHMDKMKIQNPGNKFFEESESWYRDEVIRTLEVIAEAGSILEVNTRGLYQKKSDTPYPSPWILEQALQKNIPITLSSDAHHPDDIINHFEACAMLLLSLGFKEIAVMTDGAWQLLPFNTHGIIR
jgi:histidinol-phosphatase (PHP family)